MGEDTLEIQTAYIRVFGAAVAALDELKVLQKLIEAPELTAACQILAEVIDETEGRVDLE